MELWINLKFLKKANMQQITLGLATHIFKTQVPKMPLQNWVTLLRVTWTSPETSIQTSLDREPLMVKYCLIIVKFNKHKTKVTSSVFNNRQEILLIKNKCRDKMHESLKKWLKMNSKLSNATWASHLVLQEVLILTKTTSTKSCNFLRAILSTRTHLKSTRTRKQKLLIIQIELNMR